MKIAIHHRIGSFSDRWITYCEEQNVDYKIVNAFDSDIIEQVKDCDVFMWHHHHGHYKDVLTAKRILFALEHAGVKVFPDFKTGWHFDDKVAQKYLLEAIGAPLIPSYVFYDKQEAINWAKQTSYPKVFKLKGGAGATNVRLISSEDEALKIISIAFGKGFSQYNRFTMLKERFRMFKEKQASFIYFLKGFVRLIIIPEFAKQQPPEKGYVYFQDFVANNDHDTRVVVINGKAAAAEKRFVRKNDFRASGSGKFTYDKINTEIIKVSFEVANKLELQSAAFDFVLDENNIPVIVELSYGFGTKGISAVPGYWDYNMNWYETPFIPEEIMIDNFFNIENNNRISELLLNKN